MTMEGVPEIFQPLVTQVQALPHEPDWVEEAVDSSRDLPRGLDVLARAGSRFRKTLLVSMVLAVVSLAELGVLLFFPKSTQLVVWEDRVMKPLVEVP